MTWFTDTWEVLKEAAADWMEDNAARMGAALAFYSTLSLAPLLMIALNLAGMFFNAGEARDLLIKQVSELIGPQGSEAIRGMLDAGGGSGSTLAAIFGVVMLIFGASGVFGELQAAMNEVWDVEAKPAGIWEIIRKRFLSFGMVISTGFLLVISLLVSTTISGLRNSLMTSWPQLEPLFHALTFLVTFVVVMLLFALIFKFLPDAPVEWRHVWFGAALTAVLFSIGKLAIGLYLGNSGLASSYGAAGSLVVVIVWVYYSAQIVIFGAEITHTLGQRENRASDSAGRESP